MIDDRGRPRTNRLWLRVTTWGLLLLTLVGIAAYLGSRIDELIPLVQFPFAQVLLVAALVFAGVVANSAEMWLIYRTLGVRLGLGGHILMFSAGQVLNHIPGQVGTLYRFQYLKTVHGLSFPRAASGYGANLVLTLVVAGAMGIIAVSGIGLSESRWHIGLTLVFLALLLVSLSARTLPRLGAGGGGKIGGAWDRFRRGWTDLTRSPRTAFWVLAIETAKLLILATRIQISLSWIGVDGSYPIFMVIASVTTVVTFLAFTPAALGIREFGIGITGAALGIDFDAALLGATLDRAVALALTIVIGGVGLFYTSRRIAGSRLVQSE